MTPAEMGGRSGVQLEDFVAELNQGDGGEAKTPRFTPNLNWVKLC